MSIKKALSLKNKFLFSHHAYLLIGDREYWKNILETEFKKIFKTDNLASSPDIWWQNYESFGIKDAHVLIERETCKSFSGQGRFFVLAISSIMPEAQNALLKTFEEPALDTRFFIIARSAEIFFPTFRSRMVVLRSEREMEAKSLNGDFASISGARDESSAAAFLKLDLPDRLDFIQKEFLKNPAGADRKDKTKSEIIDFVIALEKTFRIKINLKQITKDEEFVLYELTKCQRYLQNPSSSNRLILEHLALILPL